MPRIRFIKPETFDDPDLCELPPIARWLFVGLWTQADREGRLEDDPRRVKTRLIPADDVNPEDVLKLLAPRFITRYSVEGKRFIQINNFVKHQHPHPKEAQSVIPAPVKRNGKPLKARASKPDSGVLNLDSGILNLDSGVRGEPSARSSADADFNAFQNAYPESRRVGGERARRAFSKAMKKKPPGHLAVMIAAVEQHKRSQQWAIEGVIPLMTTWLNQQRWIQVLPEPAAFGTGKTAGNVAALQRWVEKSQ